jgi:phage baseplate assembly protein W
MEIEHLLKTSGGELITLDRGQSLEKINWWLDTPKGQVWGDPNWGNELQQYAHDPVTVSMEVSMEAHILNKMSEDLPFLQIHGIRIKAIGGEATLSILTEEGLISTTFDRSKA